MLAEVGLVFRLVANGGFVAEDLLLLSPCLGRSWLGLVRPMVKKAYGGFLWTWC